MLSFYEFLLFAFIAVASYLVIDWIRQLHVGKKLPPGPPRYPVIGNLLKVADGRTSHVQLSQWAQNYGPLFMFHAGSHPVLVLADLPTIKAAFVKQGDVFAGRPKLFLENYISNQHGLLESDGPLWKEQRRFALTTLRNFGVGKPLLEHKTREECDHTVEALASCSGNPTDLQDLLNNAVSNIICQLVFGKRFDYGKSDFVKLLDNVNLVATRQEANVLDIGNYFPNFYLTLVKIFPSFQKEWDDFANMVRDVNVFVSEFVEDHKKAFCPEDEPTDFIGAFLKAQHENKGSYFTDYQLTQSIISLFFAGSETTSTTLRWGFLFMCQNPDIQDRVRKEISDLVGPGNAPSLADRSRLPYTEAVIMETQRLANLLPLSLPHSTLEETELLGYYIPKRTLVLPHLWNVHLNPEVYPDPTRFNPERFLKNGAVVKADDLIPFSIGKRICLGEALARMELFIYFTTMIQRFRFRFPPNSSPPTDVLEDRFVGVTSAPKNYELIADSLFQ